MPDNCANCKTAYLIGDSIILIQGSRSIETISLFSFDKNIKERTYNLNHVRTKHDALYDNSIGNPSDIFRTDSIRTGQLVITTFDKINKIIAGTFYFEAYNAIENKTVKLLKVNSAFNTERIKISTMYSANIKSKILIKHLFTFFLLLTIIYSAKGQGNWDTLPFKTYADFKLQTLDKDFITSNILYDRVFPVADIERFKQQDQFTDTTSSRHWIQAYYEIFNAAIRIMAGCRRRC